VSGMEPLAELPETPPNAALLALLKRDAIPARSSYRLGVWELRTHPDLMDRLQELAPDRAMLTAYGMPLFAEAGVAAVVAMGTGTLFLRLPQDPAALGLAGALSPFELPGWYGVDAWQSALPSAEGRSRLSALVFRACTHAGGVGEVARG
jgi:hypothetical protein